jgi:NYN domain
MMRWMLFVDGENFTMRAQELAKRENILLEADPTYHLRDVFVWFPGLSAQTPYPLFHEVPFRDDPIRAYYYTSAVGDPPKIDAVRGQLRALGFDPQVFKKPTGNTKSKGVDIALAKDMLVHAFEHHYEMAMLFAGDGDYVPLIEEVKRRGKNVYVAFFAGEGLGLAGEVRLVADRFLDLTNAFLTRWQGARR